MSENDRKSPFSAFRKVSRWLFDRQEPGQPHRAAYAQSVVFQHRTFDVKGLTTQGVYTLELEQIFVDLGLGHSRRDAAANPIPEMSRTLRAGRHSIWDYLAVREAGQPNLVILGAPGSGKTTLLKHLALTLATGEAAEAPNTLPEKTPILLVLRDYAPSIRKNPNYSLLKAVKAELARREVNMDLQWLEQDLQNGRCLIMLDGLDEVADLELRQQVAAWVERQIRQYQQNQFVMTSRPFGYESNPLRNVMVLQVMPFTARQVEKFVHNWYLANEIKSAQKDDPGVRLDARHGAEDLLQRLQRTPVLSDMSVNPLLLTMIATVHRYRSSLPGRRVELYEEICDVFLGKRYQARGIVSDLTPAQKKRVLQPLAHHMMRRKLREISVTEAMDVIDAPLRRVSPQSPPDEFLRMIVNTSGLLVEREAGLYGFAHLTFQEYLTAVHVQDQGIEQELVQRVEDGWWHETIRLYTAQADATNIVRACIMRKKPSILALTLAMECLEEAREVGAELRSLSERLAQGVEHDNPEVRRIGAEVLLQLRLRRMVRLGDGRYVDSTFVTHAEYQLFLEEMRQSDAYHQPDHWTSDQFEAGAGRKPVVGVRPSDAEAFCRWLTNREQGPWRYRLPTIAERQTSPILRQMTDSENPWVGYWLQESDKRYETAGPDAFDEEAARVRRMLQVLEKRLLNDLLLDHRLSKNDPAFERMRQLVWGRARHRSLALLDLERQPHVMPEDGETLTRDLEMVRNRALSGQFSELAQALTDANARLDNPNLAYARAVILDDMIELARVLSHSLEHTSYFDGAPQLVNQLLRDLSRARELTHNQRDVHNRDLLLHRHLIGYLRGALGHAQKLVHGLQKARVDARIRIRAKSLLRIIQLLYQLEDQPISGSTGVRRHNMEFLNAYIDLYVDLAILEERLQGRLPAVEGIRLVRERIR